MAISVGRNSVRGPARVADTEISRDGIGLQDGREGAVNLAALFPHEQIGLLQDGDARAVVAAIFQPPQSFEQDWRGRFFSDVSDDAAHISLTADYTDSKIIRVIRGFISKSSLLLQLSHQQQSRLSICLLTHVPLPRRSRCGLKYFF